MGFPVLYPWKTRGQASGIQIKAKTANCVPFSLRPFSLWPAAMDLAQTSLRKVPPTTAACFDVPSVRFSFSLSDRDPRRSLAREKSLAADFIAGNRRFQATVERPSTWWRRAEMDKFPHGDEE